MAYLAKSIKLCYTYDVTDANGLLYMRARYYSPEMRRFVNADILPGGISEAITLNRYAYANGNPVSFVDPFGLEANSSVGNLPINTEGYKKRMTDNLKKIPNLLSRYRDFLSEHFTVEDFEHKYSYTVGNYTYHFAISSSFGTGDLDIDKIQDILDNQIEISKSFDFAGGEFELSTGKSEIVSGSYSAQMDDYTKLTAAFKFSNDLSVGAEYKIETLLKELEGHSVTTTFGVKRNNNLTQTPQPQEVPVSVSVPALKRSDESIFDTNNNAELAEAILIGVGTGLLVVGTIVLFLHTGILVPVF